MWRMKSKTDASSSAGGRAAAGTAAAGFIEPMLLLRANSLRSCRPLLADRRESHSVQGTHNGEEPGGAARLSRRVLQYAASSSASGFWISCESRLAFRIEPIDLRRFGGDADGRAHAGCARFGQSDDHRAVFTGEINVCLEPHGFRDFDGGRQFASLALARNRQMLGANTCQHLARTMRGPLRNGE